MKTKHLIVVSLAAAASMGMAPAGQADHFMGDLGVEVEIDTSASTGGVHWPGPLSVSRVAATAEPRLPWLPLVPLLPFIAYRASPSPARSSSLDDRRRM